MKKLACQDALKQGCQWTVFADSEQDILRQAREHGERAHGLHPKREDDERILAAIRTL